MTEKQLKPCRYGCGHYLYYDPEVSPPFRENTTHIHHTYRRCAEILGPKATAAFAKDAAERKSQQKR